jgi:hypothetical protein
MPTPIVRKLAQLVVDRDTAMQFLLRVASERVAFSSITARRRHSVTSVRSVT